MKWKDFWVVVGVCMYWVLAPLAINDAMHKMFIIHRSFVFVSVTVIYLDLMLGALCASVCSAPENHRSFIWKIWVARVQEAGGKRVYVFLRCVFRYVAKTCSNLRIRGLTLLSNDKSHNVSAVLPLNIFRWLLFLAFPFFSFQLLNNIATSD